MAGEVRRTVRIEENPTAKYDCERWLVYIQESRKTKRLVAMACTKAEAMQMVVPGWPVEVIEANVACHHGGLMPNELCDLCGGYAADDLEG